MDTLEKSSDLVEKYVKSLKYILHGNSSSQNINDIYESRFRVIEGRATVSCNLVHALSWALDENNRRETYSLSTTPKKENDTGAVLVIKMPSTYTIGFGKFTDIKIDYAQKIISGDPLKYISGLKQLGIYTSQDINARRQVLEGLKMEERPNVAIDPSDFLLTIKPTNLLCSLIKELDKKI